MEVGIKWHLDSYKKLVKVRRVFLKIIIYKINEASEKEGIGLLLPDFLDKVNEKRR
jgi:hypothetical protein